jgi:hypothetical protein
MMQGEHVVFAEENNPQTYVKLIATGDLDDTPLEALEAYVQRQEQTVGKERGRQLRRPPTRYDMMTLATKHEEGDRSFYQRGGSSQPAQQVVRNNRLGDSIRLLGRGWRGQE